MSVHSLLESAIADRVFPGCAWAYGNLDTHKSGYLGNFSHDPRSRPVDDQTTWDLASMTKVLATTTVTMCLVDEGTLELETPVAEFVPETKLAGATLCNLLRHDSGLPPYDDHLAQQVKSREQAIARILTRPPECSPGAQTAYSCLGFVTLQTVLERATGEGLTTLFNRLVATPLGLKSTTYLPKNPTLCPPTGPLEPWRTGPPSPDHPGFVQGTVHDPIAWTLGGVSGNAGLFATLDDTVLIARAYLASHPALGPGVSRFTKVQTPASTRALGWDTNRDGGISAGSNFSPGSYGHTGFTGTAIWIDPVQKVFATLLTNRVYPDPQDTRIIGFRPRFFDLACIKSKGLT